MKNHNKIGSTLKVILVILALIFITSGCERAFTNSITEETVSSDPNRYLDAVREFADNVLEYGRDTYGPEHTPLFVDGLMVRDPNDPNYGEDGVFKPVEWISPEGERWVLSNLASQQNLFRTLDGLSTITGDPKYKQAAMEAIEYAFENLRSPNGLLYWGAHAAYDALSDGPCKYDTHELRGFYPYYELMWEVDPEATEEFIEAFWAAHIWDWSNLEMNRIGFFDRLMVPKGWEHEYKGGSVFFQSRGITFAPTGSDLFYAATILSNLSGQKEPLIWGKRIAYRFVETRYPKIGISSHQYNRSMDDYWLANEFKGHVVEWGTFFPAGLALHLDPISSECKVGYMIISPGIPYSYVSNPWICYLLVGQSLGDEGKEFIQWALEELTARGKVAYRNKDNVWIPMLTDGTNLEGYVIKEDYPFARRGTVFNPVTAVPIDLWAYALAYRLTKDEFMWEIARSIARGNRLGDIGAVAEGSPKLQIPKDHFNPYTLLAFLELFRKTDKTEFLQAAQEVGDNILSLRYHNGFFTPSSKHIYAKFDAIEALALLHLDVAMRGKVLSVSQVWPGRPFINLPYRNKGTMVDNSLIYALTESAEPPRSLQEVAARGDIEGVRRLIAQGADVNGRESVFLEIPLHRVSISGHIDVVELLLAHGADVNARDGSSFTPLHYATQEGHMEIAELLIGNGADINAKNSDGDTPLHSAVRAGHEDIVELLIANGADINIENNNDQTPLDIALGLNHTEIVELLQSQGATTSSIHIAAQVGNLARVEALLEEGIDVNARDGNGATALHYAATSGHTDVVELLLAHGADVNARGNLLALPLHRAIQGGHTEIAKLLIDNGSDINAKDNRGLAPLHLAARSGQKEIVEFLLAKGADASIVNNMGRTPLDLATRQGHTEIVELLREHGAEE